MLGATRKMSSTISGMLLSIPYPDLPEMGQTLLFNCQAVTINGPFSYGQFLIKAWMQA